MSLYTDIQQSRISISGNLDNGINAEFNFPDSLELFSGHFPGKPILPGIVQIEMVKFTLESICERKLIIRSVKKTKFSHLIEPDTPVLIQITRLSARDGGDQDIVSVRATLNTPEALAGRINLVLAGTDHPAKE